MAASSWVHLGRSEPVHTVSNAYAEPVTQALVGLLEMQLGSAVISDRPEHGVQRSVAQIPHVHGGLAMPDSNDLLFAAFLGGFLNTVAFYRQQKLNANQVYPLWIHAAVEGMLEPSQHGGPYERSVLRAHQVFIQIFVGVNDREPTLLEDGFDMSISSLVPFAFKFQAKAAALAVALKKKHLLSVLTPAQAKTLESGSSITAAAMCRALPTTDLSDIPNQIYIRVMNRRLLNQNLAAVVLGDVCPRKGCQQKEPMQIAELSSHVEGCILGGSHTTVRHDYVLKIVKDMAKAAGAVVSPLSPTLDPVIQSQLRAAAATSGIALPLTRFGMVKGGDLTVKFTGELPLVLDVRVPIETVAKYKSVPSAVNKAESDKRSLYSVLYKGIGYQFEGIAVDPAGRLGDGLLQLIEKCGKKANPDLLWALPGITYVTPTFSSYWSQRIVLAAQRANAEILMDVSEKLAHNRSYAPEPTRGSGAGNRLNHRPATRQL